MEFFRLEGRNEVEGLSLVWLVVREKGCFDLLFKWRILDVFLGLGFGEDRVVLLWGLWMDFSWSLVWF